MKSFIATFHSMTTAESMEDAVRQTVEEIVSAASRGEPIPFTVQDADGDKREVVLYQMPKE